MIVVLMDLVLLRSLRTGLGLEFNIANIFTLKLFFLVSIVLLKYIFNELFS